MSEVRDNEKQLMKAARFFDSQDSDFEKFLSDYFMDYGDPIVDDGFTREMADALAKDICDTYINVVQINLDESRKRNENVWMGV